MGIKITDDTLFVVIKNTDKNSKEGIRKGLLDVGPEIEREIVRLIESPPKTGRLYLINGMIHRASAPGEAPANLTGALADSADFTVPSAVQMVIGYRANIAPHGEWMEYGTRDGRIAPRPALRRATIGKAREIEQALIEGIKRELGKKI